MEEIGVGGSVCTILASSMGREAYFCFCAENWRKLVLVDKKSCEDRCRNFDIGNR